MVERKVKHKNEIKFEQKYKCTMGKKRGLYSKYSDLHKSFLQDTTLIMISLVLWNQMNEIRISLLQDLEKCEHNQGIM